MKIAIGLLVGLAIGIICRLLHIPSPAPPVLEGALLVVAMTVGYSLVDRYFAHRTATAKAHCGGPSGRCASDEASSGDRGGGSWK
jgi:XapX domain-containing protein